MVNGRQMLTEAKDASISCCENRDGGATSVMQRRSGRRLLPTLLASSLVLCLMVAVAQASDQAEPDPKVTVAEPPNQDLLLFWEEKELYVQTATRTAKPISQVAENMVVVTAKDIADMNARNVAEVLKRVPGLFVALSSSDFGTPSSLQIQGSYDRHVTVLVDGVVWNFVSGGNTEVGSIPVQIIDRIEIIKGPASSTWGSALGGIVNIITKNAGDSVQPKGMLSASYGEKDSQDYNTELYGKGGPVGYYLYAGRQSSDGLLNKREYQRNSLYGKMNISPLHNLDLTFTIGYGNPDNDMGAVPLAGIRSKTELEVFWATGTLGYRFSPELSFKIAAYTIAQDLNLPERLLTDQSLINNTRFEERTVGCNLKLIYASGVHSAVMGLDLSESALDQNVTVGTVRVFKNSLNKWALFANDTIAFGKLAITPGIRFDHNNVSGSFVAPSLGATYQLDEHVIARASVARGFNSPPVGYSGGGPRLAPNPDLTAESGWSYQAGLESAVHDYFNLKANLFRHNTGNELVPVGFDAFRGIARNLGSVVRQGYELEAESAPVYNVSLTASHAFVRIDADSRPESTVNYSYQVGIKYDDRNSFLAQLAGSYIWWDLAAGPTPALNAQYKNFIWDLNLSKKFHISETASVDTFVNLHNLFSGSHYTIPYYPNPGRWAEAGLRLNF